MARTLDRLGTLARHQGDLGRAEVCYAESLDIFRDAGDLVNAAIVMSNLEEVSHQQGRTERAAELFEAALRAQRELDLPDGFAFDLTNLARVRLEMGEIERAAALSGQAIRLFRDMGNQLGLARALAVFGMAARARGDVERAGVFGAQHKEAQRLPHSAITQIWPRGHGVVRLQPRAAGQSAIALMQYCLSKGQMHPLAQLCAPPPHF